MNKNLWHRILFRFAILGGFLVISGVNILESSDNINVHKLENSPAFSDVVNEQNYKTVSNPDNNLAGYWSFDTESRNEFSVFDLSQHENNEVVSGVTFEEGMEDIAVQFDGVDDYISIPDSSSLKVNDNFTIEAFVNNKTDGTIFATDNGNAYYGYFFDIVNGKLRYRITSAKGGTVGEIFSNNYIGNSWTHVAVTHNGAELKLYINGELENFNNEGSSIIYDTTVYHHIGRASIRKGIDRFLKGGIDELKVYNKALTADEISEEYLIYTRNNQVCDEGENSENAPNDCVCGNNICEGDETTETCSSDCKSEYEHPYLFFNNSELEELREKAQDVEDNEYGFKPKESFEIIKVKADSFLSDYSYNVEHICRDGSTNPDGSSATFNYVYNFSNEAPTTQTCNICCPWSIITADLRDRMNYLTFTYAITQEEKYRDKLKEIILALSDWDKWWDSKISINTQYLVRGMSFAYDVIYDDLTNEEKTKIRTAIVEKGLKPLSSKYLNDPLVHNMDAGNLGACGMGLLAIKNEDQFANNQNINRITTLIEKYLSDQDSDGGMYEGIAYGSVAMNWLMKGMIPIKRLGIQDFFQTDFLTKVWDYPIYLTAQGSNIAFNDSGSGLYWQDELAYASGILENKTASWYLKENGFKFTDPFSFIWLKDDVEFEEPEGTSKLFTDMGTSVLRYDWEEESPVMFFKSGPKEEMPIHAQYDQNTFSIRYGNDWLARDAGYKQNETFKHNTLLVDGEGQDDRFGGEITDFYNSKYYDYVIGDASAVYDDLNKFDRQIIYIKPDYFIVYDEVETSEEHDISWILHSNEIVLNDNSFELVEADTKLLGAISSNKQLESTIEQMGLTSGTQVGSTNYSEYLNSTINSSGKNYFLSLLYPQEKNATDNEIIAIGNNAYELKYENKVDFIGVDKNQNQSFFASKGTVECDGFLCVVGMTEEDYIYRLVLDKGKYLKLNDKELFSSDKNITIAIKKEDFVFQGDISLEEQGTISIATEYIDNLLIDSQEVTEYQFEEEKVTFTLSSGQHKISFESCIQVDEGIINQPFIDFNKNSKSEILIWSKENGKWYSAELNSENNLIKIIDGLKYGSSGKTDWVPIPADYNGDNQTDIAVWMKHRREKSNQVFEGPGLWYFDDVLIQGNNDFQFGESIISTIPIFGDYDGDNIDDIGIYYKFSGTFEILKSSENFDKEKAIKEIYGNNGVTYWIPVPGDYDGDGKTDIAVWKKVPYSNETDSAIGYWYYKSSLTGESVNLGNINEEGTYIPVPSDYDGDGKTDIAIWDIDNGFWYIQKSSDDSELSVQLGKEGSTQWIPIPDDYDGDGKTDIAVWNKINGTVKMLLSSDAYNVDDVIINSFGSTGEQDWLVISQSNLINYLLLDIKCIDADGDGYGLYCELGPDCNDNDASINPGAEDINYDGIDNNCNEEVDENNPVCIDTDGDGYGLYCELGPDCNDNDASINPSAEDINYDGIDNNCNEEVDENNPVCIDEDGDGYGLYCELGPDCNDNDANINPGVEDINYDGIDNNCNEEIDENNPVCIDADGDGYGLYCELGPDCNDNDASINPSAEDINYDGIDNNCNEEIDENNPICIDNDGDGYGENCELGPDCNDNDASINPSAEDINYDGIDNNCNEEVDENNPVCIDEDGDGYGLYCELGPDCNDNDANINPGVEDINYDGIDNNCNEEIDENNPVCIDTDGDGYGENCELGPDCNDNEFKSNSGIKEICSDGIDNNCNGHTDENCMLIPSPTSSSSGGGGGGGGSSGSSNSTLNYNIGSGGSIFVPTPTVGSNFSFAILANPKEQKIELIKENSKLLFEEKLDLILEKLQSSRDIVVEQFNKTKYLEPLKKGIKELSTKVENIINIFITYGIDDNTKRLGAGERTAVVYSYNVAFGKLPETEEELTDMVKIANGYWPTITNEKAEEKAKTEFQKIYKKIPDMSDAHDDAAITVMAYGLRQRAENRNLDSERNGIKTFKNIYGHNPSNTEEWNILQAITYSGSSRGIDTDKDLLTNDRELLLGTDPNNPDTDGDGYLDGLEVLYEHNPLVK